MVLYVYKMDIVSFLWLNVIGAILTIMLAIILQAIFKETVKV
jgi:SSS family solute:Na+ symporter